MPRKGLKTVVVFGSGDQKFPYPPKSDLQKIWVLFGSRKFKSQKIHEDERGFTVSQTRGNRNHHMSCAEKKRAQPQLDRNHKLQILNSQHPHGSALPFQFVECVSSFKQKFHMN